MVVSSAGATFATHLLFSLSTADQSSHTKIGFDNRSVRLSTATPLSNTIQIKHCKGEGGTIGNANVRQY
jgi:hypothetical protein